MIILILTVAIVRITTILAITTTIMVTSKTYQPAVEFPPQRTTKQVTWPKAAGCKAQSKNLQCSVLPYLKQWSGTTNHMLR